MLRPRSIAAFAAACKPFQAEPMSGHRERTLDFLMTELIAGASSSARRSATMPAYGWAKSKTFHILMCPLQPSWL
jgi:hypothetical protein